MKSARVALRNAKPPPTTSGVSAASGRPRMPAIPAGVPNKEDDTMPKAENRPGDDQ